MNDEMVKKAVERIRMWPRPERVFLTKLTMPEAELIGEAAVLLGAKPCDPPEPGPSVVEIP